MRQPPARPPLPAVAAAGALALLWPPVFYGSGWLSAVAVDRGWEGFAALGAVDPYSTVPLLLFWVGLLSSLAGYLAVSGLLLRLLGLPRPWWAAVACTALPAVGLALAGGAPFGWYGPVTVLGGGLGALTAWACARPRPVLLFAVAVGLAVMCGYGMLAPDSPPGLTVVTAEEH